MRSTIKILILVLALLVMLTACNLSDKPEESSTEDQSSIESTTVEEEPSETESSEPESSKPESSETTTAETQTTETESSETDEAQTTETESSEPETTETETETETETTESESTTEETTEPEEKIYLEMSIPEVLEADKGALVSVYGVVVYIDAEWDDQEGVMSVIICDDDLNELSVYKLTTYVELYDAVIIKGEVDIDRNGRYITEGATAEIVEYAEEPDPYRESISKSHDEVKAMLTITDNAYTTANTLLETFKKVSVESTDIAKIYEALTAFEESFYYVSTQLSIATIIYNIDMSDEDAYNTYFTIYEKYGEIYDNYMEAVKYIYENSPVRDQIFEGWTEQDIAAIFGYSPEITALQLQNEELLNQLNNLGEEEFGDVSAQIYAQIVTNNNKIAKLEGYDNYYDYASEMIYGRDYGREELEAFCNNAAERLVPLYTSITSDFYAIYDKASEEDFNLMFGYLYSPFDAMEKNYLTDYIASLSGSMKEGMEHIFVNRNMVFSNSEYSHQSAFQIYLDDLGIPFCLFGIYGQTTDTMVHEIGHYYAALYNTVQSYDLAEVQSQTNELLLLDYLKDQMSQDAYELLKYNSMLNDIANIIICCIIDEFEREVYALDSVEGFKSADFDAIMEKVCVKYGGIDNINANLTDVNYYWRMVATNNPVYYISYAVSNTAALNIYSVTCDDRNAGRELYRVIVEEVTNTDTFLSALNAAGIASPFTDEAIDNIIYSIYGDADQGKQPDKAA